MSRRVLVLVVVLATPGCASGPAPRASGSEASCPAGSEPTDDRDSDVGWGEVEATRGCARRDGTLDGPAVEVLSLTSTTLRGRYSNGKRVGTWLQRNEATGAEVGTFTLDESGSGVEVVRDTAGHSRRGTVVRGKREGTWTYYDRDGRAVATATWSGGAFVRRVGAVPWDPPMLDPKDACPEAPTDESVADGCPDTRAK